MKDDPIASSLVGHAKARVERWCDASGDSGKMKAKVVAGVDAVARELALRREWFEVATIGLDDGGEVSIRVDTSQSRAFPVGAYMAVATITPGWRFGWRDILVDEDVYEILTWFLHYARQYIHRSHIARVLMIVWETRKRVLNPFGSWTNSTNYRPDRPMLSSRDTLQAAVKRTLQENPGSTDIERIPISSSNWQSINTLDPWIHQAVFYFLRAQDLRNQNFEVESVVALDCAIQSIGQFLKARHLIQSIKNRGSIFKFLGLGSESSNLAEYMYFVRNNFGAHAGGWRWWDVHENVDDAQLEEYSGLVQDSMVKLGNFETSTRRVEPVPLDWPVWFFEHFELLWDTVWFERFDQWMARRSVA